MRGILSADQTVDKLANTSRQPRIIYNNDPPLQDFQINLFWIFHPFTFANFVFCSYVLTPFTKIQENKKIILIILEDVSF